MNKLLIDNNYLKTMIYALRCSFSNLSFNFTKKGLIGTNINDIGTVMCEIKLLGDEYEFDHKCDVNICTEFFYSLIKSHKGKVYISKQPKDSNIIISNGVSNIYSFTNIDKNVNEKKKIKSIPMVQLDRITFNKCVKNMINFSDLLHISFIDKQLVFQQTNIHMKAKHIIDLKDNKIDTDIYGSGCYTVAVIKSLLLVSKYLEKLELGIDENNTLHFYGCDENNNSVTFYIADMIEE